MKEQIEKRFESLIQLGQRLISQMPRNEYGSHEYWVDSNRLTEYHSWIYSVNNFLNFLSKANSIYANEMASLLETKEVKGDVASDSVKKIFGLLNSAFNEWKEGFLERIEFIIAAETFDDFLDHSEDYHKSNKKVEASVLASAVLEDTLKKIALKNSVSQNQSLEPLIDELTSNNVFTPVKAKKFKSYVGIRNSALHARWDEFDIKDVGYLIKGIKELIEDYL